MLEKAKANPQSNIKKIIAVMSGKGGVGKSTVTALTALALSLKDYKVGILDADITGPSIPKIFGVNHLRAFHYDGAILPVETLRGIKIMSLNLILEQEDAPVIWRGPLLGSAVQQFYTDVAWGDLDYLIIDLPPGTGDIALTTMQSLPIDGIIAVTSPQDLANLIVGKSVNMALMMNIPILGLVENMSYFVCPTCQSKHELFGPSHLDSLAEKENLPIIYRVPLNMNLVQLADAGKFEDLPLHENRLVEDFTHNLLSVLK